MLLFFVFETLANLLIRKFYDNLFTFGMQMHLQWLNFQFSKNKSVTLLTKFCATDEFTHSLLSVCVCVCVSIVRSYSLWNCYIVISLNRNSGGINKRKEHSRLALVILFLRQQLFERSQHVEIPTSNRLFGWIIVINRFLWFIHHFRTDIIHTFRLFPDFSAAQSDEIIYHHRNSIACLFRHNKTHSFHSLH